ncbi:MAG: sigma-54 dependent transcriptional regulator [Bacteroidales bacterium]|nr:sigma-54 dependent transcriptional regulator [Bacteroidales bacterium]
MCRMDIQSIKQRFGIIGNSQLLDRAIDIARQVASTDLTVLITGESGSGKEVFPKIIHQLSSRKHGPYIAVNCGAIPEGTIDSELFGHEKGSFTGAHEARKGYFEVVNGGIIFLDEIADLPLPTQVRLLRIIETGELLKVGSSKVQKTNVRVIAATNVNMLEAVNSGKFREDLYYRLNTVPIHIPSLRERKEDILLLFRKFAADFAEKYRMPAIVLDEEAQNLLVNYRWQGNVRQLKNVSEQISVIESTRNIDAQILQKYLPEETSTLPVLFKGETAHTSEREILYNILFDMRKDVNDLKKVVFGILQNPDKSIKVNENVESFINKTTELTTKSQAGKTNFNEPIEFVEESLSIQEKEKDLIIKALEKNKGKRRNAAKELGISERTLYRKIKEYNIKL